MTIWQTIRIAWVALMRNKLRSFLTALGIIIGVFAVIALVAVGQGARVAVQSAFSGLGSNMLVLVSGANQQGGALGGFGSQPTLRWGDLAAIQREVPSVRFASPVLRASGQVQTEEANWGTGISGVSPDYFSIQDWRTSFGRLLVPADVDGRLKVVVLGQTVVEKLYGARADPVGQTLRVKSIPFVVVGVLAKKGQSIQGQDLDDAIFVPYTTFRSKIQGGLEQYIQGIVMIGAVSEAATQTAQRQITALLRDRHHLRPDEDDDFSIRDLAQVIGAVTAGTAAITGLLAAVAGVSLLVGGIGIMNIMLVGVTERTREIGLRMAVGARTIHIMAQFLAESVVLSVAGGSLGILLGLATAKIVASLFNLVVPIRPGVIALAVGFSAAVGIGFGLYPARKASRMDPIDALRFE
jgi:putative ABC transport system permease protein